MGSDRHGTARYGTAQHNTFYYWCISIYRVVKTALGHFISRIICNHVDSLLRYDRSVIVVVDDLRSFHAISVILALSYALLFVFYTVVCLHRNAIVKHTICISSLREKVRARPKCSKRKWTAIWTDCMKHLNQIKHTFMDRLHCVLHQIACTTVLCGPLVRSIEQHLVKSVYVCRE